MSKYQHKSISGTHDVENCWCMNHEQIKDKLIAKIQAYLSLELDKQDIKSRVAEHKWYEKHEVYQLNGQPIMQPPAVRVVQMEDVNKRLASLQSVNKKESV